MPLDLITGTETLMRMFKFLGFELLPPHHELNPLDGDEESICMAYDGGSDV